MEEKTAQMIMYEDISFTQYTGEEMVLRGLTITEGDKILEIGGAINHVIKGDIMYMGATATSNIDIEFTLDLSFSLGKYGIESLEINEN